MRLELVCSVISEGQTFLVKTNGNQRVYKLKTKIQREIADLTPVNTRAITLYVAKNKYRGRWLPDNSETEKLLKELVRPRAFFDEMRSSFLIKNREFCFQSAAGDGLIHILVELEGSRALQVSNASPSQETSSMQVGSLQNQVASENSPEYSLSDVVERATHGTEVASTQMSWWQSIMRVARIVFKHATNIWEAVTYEVGKGLEEVLRMLYRRFMAASSANQGRS